MLATIGLIARSTELPVTADLERGYGDVGETVGLALEHGAAGCNLEDSTPDGLRDIEDAAARVAAARAVAESAGIPFVINARADTRDVDDVLRRGKAYLEAGADCVFAIALSDANEIRAVCGELDGKVAVLARPGSTSIAELGRLGVARVSVGPGSMGAAYSALAETAATLLGGGEPPAALAFRP